MATGFRDRCQSAGASSGFLVRIRYVDERARAWIKGWKARRRAAGKPADVVITEEEAWAWEHDALRRVQRLTKQAAQAATPDPAALDGLTGSQLAAIGIAVLARSASTGVPRTTERSAPVEGPSQTKEGRQGGTS